jgi:hypothetical protein
MTVPSRRLTSGLGVAALSVVLVSGCSSGSGGGAESASPSASETAQGRVDAVPVLAEGWDGVRDDVTVDECPLEPGEVTAKGTVKNTAKGARDIVLVVAWNAPDSTNPLLQLSTTEKSLGPGKSAQWSVSGKLPSEAGQCIVLARSGNLTKG